MNRSPIACAILLALAAPAYAVPVVEKSADQQQQDASSSTHSDTSNKTRTLEPVTVTGVPLGQRADDIVAPVAVLSGQQLDDRKANTLGETVASIPGVTTTHFGAGVGRPVIRGLDGPRVGVLSDGMGTNDVSNISQDHAVTLEPFLSEQIEVLKGPATLLYGSGAIGGVVNAVDGRIRETATSTAFSGRSELRYDAGSAGFTGMGRVDTGTDRYNLHADAVYRDNDDYDLAEGVLANSAVDTSTGALGASMFGDWGFAGLSVARHLNGYGNPAEPGDESDPPVTLELAQTRIDLKAGLNNPFAGVDRLKFSLANTDYQHTEFEGDEVGTKFLGSGNELRVEGVHREMGAWHGAFGAQVGRKKLQAIGEEAFVPSTRTESHGVFLVEQGEWDRFKLELGARADRQSSEPELADRRAFSLLSFSAGGRWNLGEAWHLSLNLDRAQRAPAEEELFANGPHVATATFEIGDRNLRKETSRQAELGLHVHGERFSAEVAAYRNRFNDFIYLADSGEFDAESELPIRTWTQTDATFRGLEGEATVELAENDAGRFELRLFADRVRAERDDGGNLPRIPAARFGSDLTWTGDAWRGGIGAVHTRPQNATDTFETPTDGYTLVNANLGYAFQTGDNYWEAFLQGSNLTNQEARLATSVVKDAVPLPGRSISVGVRLLF